MDANFAPTSTPGEDDADDGATSEDASVATRGRQMGNKKPDLRRGVLDRGRSGKPRGDDNGSASHSRASTPAGSATGAGEDQDMSDGSDEEDEREAQTWIHYYTDAQGISRRREIKPNEPYRRQIYNLYGNLAIYCFFRMFTILYERLAKLKNSENSVREVVRRNRQNKAAVDLAMMDKDPSMFFGDTGPNANYYSQMLGMFEELLRGEIEMPLIEDVLRRFYLHNGWQLFSFERMVSSLTRFAIAILTTDGGKERSMDILEAFKKDRKKEQTTHADELAYRRQVEKYVKDGDVYRIAYNTAKRESYVRLLKRDETTYDNVREDGLLDPEQRWSYYVSSFTSLEPTEGVRQEEVQLPMLKRTRRRAEFESNQRPAKRAKTMIEGPQGEQEIQESSERSTQLPEATKAKGITSAEAGVELQLNGKARWDQLRSRENLGLRIDQDSYKLTWPRPGTGADEEWWYAFSPKSLAAKPAVTEVDKAAGEANGTSKPADTEGETRTDGEQGEKKATGSEPKEDHDDEHTFYERFIMNNSWMKGASRDEVDRRNSEFREWVGLDKGEGDVEMGGS